MADGRRRSTAKQARRDARRGAAIEQSATQETPQDVPLVGEVREALDTGQPLGLLHLVSVLILATASRTALRPPEAGDPPTLAELVAAFIDVQVPETTALLAVLGELLVGDDELQAQCRHAVAARHDPLPPWLAALAQTSVDQVVRMTHVLGDGDEVLIGARLADGRELTCAVHVDHLTTSGVKDAFFVPAGLTTVLDVAKAGNDDPDTSFVDLELADARAELQTALGRPPAMFALEESDTWPA